MNQSIDQALATTISDMMQAATHYQDVWTVLREWGKQHGLNVVFSPRNGWAIMDMKTGKIIHNPPLATDALRFLIQDVEQRIRNEAAVEAMESLK